MTIIHNNLRPILKEIQYQREQFYESLRVQGISCKIWSINEVTSTTTETPYDFYGDVKHDVDSFGESFLTRITFDTSPSIYTLKSLGWYDSMTDGLPILAHIPAVYEKYEENPDDPTHLIYTLSEFSTKIDDRIELISNPTDTYIKADSNQFQIKKLLGMGFPNVIYYVANVVPYRRTTP